MPCTQGTRRDGLNKRNWHDAAAEAEKRILVGHISDSVIVIHEYRVTLMIENVKSEREISNFYDALASGYDTMTGFEKRFITERPFFRLIKERYGIKTAVDAGCGTGFHSLVLAQLGVNVTAVDISAAMLQQLAEHSLRLNLPVQAVRAEFERLSQFLDGSFDAVLCLGNSLAHVLSDEHLHTTLGNFYSLLSPGGNLFVQILNYDRILAQGERVQNVKEIGDTTFIRFYDYEDRFVRFNILKLQKKNDVIEQSLNTITLSPIRRAELETTLRNVGFDETSFFGGISLEPYVPEKSKDLVAVARKPKS
ncbi:MAG: class I SAM-dependent methyltransferase [Bacteroidetes bacterium]|nr:class I SAM-dependent methyltransferase [Bacteroidota bacterium]MCW5896532.1 class I SAM-dependent methyltransferase [Bacteroidota bacterium]